LNSVRRISAATVAVCALTVTGGLAPTSPRSTAARTAVGLVALTSAVPAAMRNGVARSAGRIALTRTLTVNLGLPFRHERYLDWFINHRAAMGRYMTKSAFDHEFDPTAAQVQRIEQWARAEGLALSYASPDRLIVSVKGRVAALDTAFHVHVLRYRVHGALRYANSTAPLVPLSLGVQSISGLDNIRRAVHLDVRRESARRHTIPLDGLTPDTIRTAYEMAGYTINGATIDGTDQTVGITGFGETVPNNAFTAFRDNEGGPLICAPALGKCPSGSDTLVWYQLHGKVTSDPDIDEQALDVEYVHGLAPHVRVNYYLGADGADNAMEDSIDQAASNPSIRVVSNSWGDPGWESSSGNNSFVIATQNYFKKAVATGTTFYFSTGDNAADSGCAGPDGQVTPCGLPSYPADSPYVVAVGGTNLQLTSDLSAWQSETTWNLGGGDWGSGGGCASFLPRPAWQTGVNSASCKGRAIPDVSAAGDANNSPIAVWEGPNQLVEVGGTSVAASLIAGEAIDTNSFLTLEHGINSALPPTTGTSATCSPASTQWPTGFCWMGWAAPEIYKLANSVNYNSNFHDVVCGSNTWSARQGWDQATGWGSLNWYDYSQSFAGIAVTPVSPAASWICTPSIGSSSNLSTVACEPTYHCHIGGSGGTLLHSPDAWHFHPPTKYAARAAVTDMTCPSINVCYSTMASGWIQKTTDGGKLLTAINPGLKSASAISCSSRRSCVVAGSGVSTTADGKTFTKRSDPLTSTLVGLSCAGSFCAAITAAGSIIESTNSGVHWKIVPVTTPSGTLTSISCPAALTCVAVGTATTANGLGGTALVFSTTNGVAWTQQTLPGTETALASVSCATTTICDAVGLGEVVRTIDGSNWTPIASTVPHAQYRAITCPTTGMCFVVGSSGRYMEVGASPGH
jgi:pseudomonalisin